jgi:hypothetical protein
MFNKYFPIYIKNKYLYWITVGLIFLLFNPITVLFIFLYGFCGTFTCEAGLEPSWFMETFILK